MSKYPKAFMETLGNYLYGYLPNGIIDDTAEYIGKGVDKRCLDHVSEKGLDPDNLFIIGRNLEQYAKTTPAEEIASFAVEAFNIATRKPKYNTASGRYNELWIVTKLSDLFLEWKKSQINILEEMNKFISTYIEDLEKIKGYWGSGSSFMLSAGRFNSVERYLNITPMVDSFDNFVRLSFSNSTDMTKEERAQKWLSENPQYNATLNKSGDTVDIKGLPLEEAIELWSGE